MKKILSGYDDDGNYRSRDTVVVLQPNRDDPTPLLYRPDGTPLVKPERKVGFGR